MNIGILALQGDFKEHKKIIEKCHAHPLEVKTLNDLALIDKLIIPGGESTTIGRLLEKTGIGQRIIELYKEGLSIYGTCAGAIIVAKEIINYEQYKLGLMDIAVTRNAYGRQVESFEKNIQINLLGEKPYLCIFIRAPIINSISKNVEVLAKENNNIIMARQGRVLVTTFHPELTDDIRIHDYFIKDI